MINWNESDIILAVIGCLGLLSTLAVVSRASRANDRLERQLKAALAVAEVVDSEEPVVAE